LVFRINVEFANPTSVPLPTSDTLVNVWLTGFAPAIMICSLNNGFPIVTMPLGDGEDVILLLSPEAGGAKFLALVAVDVVVELLLTLFEGVEVSGEAKASETICVLERHSATSGNAKITCHFCNKYTSSLYDANIRNERHPMDLTNTGCYSILSFLPRSEFKVRIFVRSSSFTVRLSAEMAGSATVI
jgi:hypothetical protein